MYIKIEADHFDVIEKKIDEAIELFMEDRDLTDNEMDRFYQDLLFASTGLKLAKLQQMVNDEVVETDESKLINMITY